MSTQESISSPQGKASTTRKTFSRETAVSLPIQADSEIIWALLTNAADMPRWNSTIVRIEGRIASGHTIRLVSTLDPSRTFKLKIIEWEPARRMVWADGMAPFFRGVRTYTLTPQPDQSTRFTMREKMSGLMFPMAAKHLPDFGPSFEQFAADLKQEAETIASAEK